MARRTASNRLGTERGWVPPRHGGDFRVALAFPGGYRAGMSSLGFQTVLFGFASLPGVLAERVFLEDEGAALQVMDAGFAPAEADVLAFSVSGENDYENVLRVLSLAGLPLRAADRVAGHPLVLAGGIAPTLNPEPLAPFVDAVAIGEGEEMLGPIVDAVRAGNAGRFEDSRAGARRSQEEQPSPIARRSQEEQPPREDPRAGTLRRLAAIGSVYVPALYEPRYAADGTLAAFVPAPGAPATVRRATVADLDAWPTLGRTVAPGSEFEELCIVEVNRGCGRGCRFCAAGRVVRPLRHRSLAALRATIAEGARLQPRVGLLGAAVADHPDILPLARELAAAGRGFSLSSLRLDHVEPELLELLARGGTRTATFAPETGSERLRFAVGKRITDDQVLEAAELAAAAGIRQLKLYFMIGLPTETPEDREAIPDLVRRVRHRLLAARREKTDLVRLAVTIGCFVPKAWTPFQWHPFAGVKALKEDLHAVVRELKKVPNTDVTHDLPKWSYVQALLSLGDRRAADILERAVLNGGDWARAARESPVNPDFFVTRGRERNELLPWDFIDVGLTKSALRAQYERALGGAAADGGAQDEGEPDG